MVATDEAKRFIRDNGADLCHVGDSAGDWTTVHSDYSWHKHSDVYFTVVTADPEGALWQYTVRSNYTYGSEVHDDVVPVRAVAETKTVISYAPRLVRK